jgi:hypothetical protein
MLPDRTNIAFAGPNTDCDDRQSMENFGISDYIASLIKNNQAWLGESAHLSVYII